VLPKELQIQDQVVVVAAIRHTVFLEQPVAVEL
jgi:hypothetical protein